MIIQVDDGVTRGMVDIWKINKLKRIVPSGNVQVTQFRMRNKLSQERGHHAYMDKDHEIIAGLLPMAQQSYYVFNDICPEEYWYFSGFEDAMDNDFKKFLSDREILHNCGPEEDEGYRNAVERSIQYFAERYMPLVKYWGR